VELSSPTRFEDLVGTIRAVDDLGFAGEDHDHLVVGIPDVEQYISRGGGQLPAKRAQGSDVRGGQGRERPSPQCIVPSVHPPLLIEGTGAVGRQ